MARGPPFAQLLPHVGQLFDRFVVVAGRDSDNLSLLQAVEVAEQRPAFGMGALVGQNEDEVAFALSERHGKVVLEVLCDDNSLLHDCFLSQFVCFITANSCHKVKYLIR